MTEATREAALVLACARAAPGACDASRIAELVRTGVDWRIAVALAVRHGLAPFMHRSLALAGVVLPLDAAAKLWADTQWSAQRGHEMADELHAIAAALLAARIRFVPFKGPLLAERLLGDAGLRESGDLDFVVAPRDVLAARAVLESLGYQLQDALDGDRERLWLASPGRHELAFRHPERPFMVELQWRANPELDVPRVADDEWWDRAPRFSWRGLELTAIPAEEEALALLVHGSKHAWASIHWTLDIAQLARRAEIAWPALVALAHRHRAARRVALGLAVAERVHGIELPEVARGIVESARIEPMVARIVEKLADAQYQPFTIRQAFRMRLALCDTRADQVRCIAASLRPTPGDWAWARLPRGLWWLYWPLRPVRLAAKYGGSLLSRRSPRTPAAATPRTPPPRPHSTG